MEEETNMHLFSTDERSKQLFTTFYPALCLFANRILNNFDEAEDIVQNVFITLLHKKVKINKINSLKAYLYSSVHNACINHLKHQAYITEKMKDFEQEVYEENSYLLQQIESEIMEEIFSTIEKLPEECRKVFKLSYIDGMEVCKVAETLQISENTVKTQRLRARKFLKENLKDLFPLLVIIFPCF